MCGRTSFVALVGIVLSTSAAAQTSQPAIVEQLDVGSAVTVQGCVQRAAEPGAYVITQIMQWPMVRTPVGQYGLTHYWTRNLPPELASFVGDTVQMEGTVVSIRKSEIELEPGLRPFGAFVEFERPGRNVLVDPAVLDIDPSKFPNREDIPITLLEMKVDKTLRVMQGCLPKPRAARGETAHTR